MSTSLPLQTTKEHIDDADIAVFEFKSILIQLKHILSNFPTPLQTSSPFMQKDHNNNSKKAVVCTPQDVIYVHLYLSDMSHFTHINQYYQEFFGSVLPPSRSCVSIGKGFLPEKRSVCLDCMVLRGSGRFMRPITTAVPSLSSDEAEEEYVQLARLNPHHKLRSTLHVQSISHWAPVCVGPYSQANVIRGGIMCLAGQIGLEPNSMKLISSSASEGEEKQWMEELKQSWKNAARVLDALCEDNSSGGAGTLNDCLGGLIYITSKVLSEKVEEGNNDTKSLWWEKTEQICRDALKSNCGVQVGSVDGTRGLGSGGGSANDEEDDELFGGYEDEGTWREIEGNDVVDAILAKRNRASKTTTDEDGDDDITNYKPLLMVCIPQMPVGASAEVELVCATKRASSCLGGVRNVAAALASKEEEGSYVSTAEGNTETMRLASVPNNVNDNPIQWETGYSNTSKNNNATQMLSSSPLSIHIQSDVAYIGHGCAAIAYVSASLINGNRNAALSTSTTPLLLPFPIEHVLDKMIAAALAQLETHAGLDHLNNVLNVRLYHVVGPHSTGKMHDTGMKLRCALHSVLSSWFGQQRYHPSNISITPPACTVVPVQALQLRTSSSFLKKGKNYGVDGKSNPEWMAMQLFVADPVHMETEMWIHHGRSYP